jgi:hypothetical protein
MRHVLLGTTDPGFVPEEGTRQAEIASVDLIFGSGSSETSVRRGDALTIQVDIRTNEPVADLDVGFDILDGATNHAVLDARTSSHGIPIPRFDGKKRVRFRIGSFPYTAGKYWITIRLSSRETGRQYHVQTQRYGLDVVDAVRVQERIDVPVEVEVEDL